MIDGLVMIRAYADNRLYQCGWSSLWRLKSKGYDRSYFNLLEKGRSKIVLGEGTASIEMILVD